MFRSSFLYFFMFPLLLDSLHSFPLLQYPCWKDPPPDDYWDVPHDDWSDLYCTVDIDIGSSTFLSIISIILRLVGYIILGKLISLLFSALNFSLIRAIMKLEDQIQEKVELEKEINKFKMAAGKQIQELNTMTQKFNVMESKIKGYEGDSNVLMNLSIHSVLEMEMKLQSNIQIIAELKTKVL